MSRKDDGSDRLRVVTSPARAAAIIAWLRAADGVDLDLLELSGPVPRRTVGEVSVYARFIMRG